MELMDNKHMLIGAALAALAIFIIVKKKGAAADVGAAVGAAAIDMAGGAVAGVSEGLGDAVGLPRTNAAKCQECLANGDTLGASIYCPAGTFISSQGVGGVVAAGAEAIGGAVGIPQTNMTECQKAMAEGRTLDASFACPASEFLGYINPFK